MRPLLVVVALVGTGWSATASASEMTVAGQVMSVTSRWTADGSRIVTDATVRTDAGDVVVTQLGGSVDGIAQRTFPGPEMLAAGMHVSLSAREAMDLSQRKHVVIEGVKVLEYPPGYVRTGPTTAGKYLYWESGCVYLTMDDAGTADVAGDSEFAIIENSIQSWNNGAASCSYMELLNTGRKAMEVGRDNVNLIKFRDVSWCRPASKDDPARCHPDSAAGITTATYVDDEESSRDGAIVDADIELNAVNFSISVNDVSLGNQSCKSDLQNTLTHELGHLLGLEHTCLAPGDPPRVDDKGSAVPSCNNASPTLQETTMFNYQQCGEVKKQTLEADDIAAVCGIYPKANDPERCDPVGGEPGCLECSGGGSPRGSLILSMLVGLVLLRPFWRRRR
jgi:hypothetical protein